MKSMVVLALVAVLVPAALSKPSGWPLGVLGGVGLGHGHGGLISVAPAHAAVVAAPAAISHSSLVQTHPSPVHVVAAHGPTIIAGPAVHAVPAVHAAVAPGPRSAVIAGPSGTIVENQGVVGTVAVAGHGLGVHGLGVHGLGVHGLGVHGLGVPALGLGHGGVVIAGGHGHHW